jgi:hypothetical protein
MSEQPALVARYAAAVQTGRALANQAGPRYDEDPAWRANERVVEDLWKQAIAEQHTIAELLAATTPKEDA